jgi:hypothetical protein
MTVRFTILGLACGIALLASAPSAMAGERFGVLWPKIYAPVITGSLFDAPDDGFDQAYGSDDDYEELVPRVERRAVKRVQKPKKFAEKPKPKKKLVTTEKPLAKAALVVIKPKLKQTPMAESSAPVAVLAPSPKAVLALPVETPAPKQDFKAKPVVAAVAPVAAAPKAPSSNTIGCSKGVEIIEGYGFGAVKPKTCSGATYAFDAQRANSAYVIQLSAATGEITDVKKLN